VKNSKGKNKKAKGYECHHCWIWVNPGEFHDCWTTTETALTEDLSEDLREAWERLREEGAAFGEQRIYASGTCIMFSRKVCYFFVRPRRRFLEVCIFLDRAVKGPQVRRSEPASKTKIANILRIHHRDEVETPITDWLREAYELPDKLVTPATTKRHRRAKARPRIRDRASLTKSRATKTRRGTRRQ